MKSSYSRKIDLYLAKALKCGTNFDVIRKDIKTKKNKAVLYYLSSLVNESYLSFLMQGINELTSFKYAKGELINGNVYYKENKEEILVDILNGVAAIIVDRLDYVIMVDIRYYPIRSISEPISEQTTRGAKDGFVESINTNVGLIRRRIKDDSFTIENFVISSVSKNIVSLVYLDKYNPDFVLLSLGRYPWICLILISLLIVGSFIYSLPKSTCVFINSSSRKSS